VLSQRAGRRLDAMLAREIVIPAWRWQHTMKCETSGVAERPARPRPRTRPRQRLFRGEKSALRPPAAVRGVQRGRNVQKHAAGRTSANVNVR